MSCCIRKNNCQALLYNGKRCNKSGSIFKIGSLCKKHRELEQFLVRKYHIFSASNYAACVNDMTGTKRMKEAIDHEIGLRAVHDNLFALDIDSGHDQWMNNLLEIQQMLEQDIFRMEHPEQYKKRCMIQQRFTCIQSTTYIPYIRSLNVHDDRLIWEMRRGFVFKDSPLNKTAEDINSLSSWYSKIKYQTDYDLALAGIKMKLWWNIDVNYENDFSFVQQCFSENEEMWKDYCTLEINEFIDIYGEDADMKLMCKMPAIKYLLAKCKVTK